MPAPQTVPIAVRPAYDEIIKITSEFCAAHLDSEYSELCERLAAKLARKRPSPLHRGSRSIWAAGILYTIGRVNFLSDPSQTPHMTTEAMASILDVKPRTAADKGRQITNLVGMSQFDDEWSTSAMKELNPFRWLIEVNGLIVDARALPVELQQEAYRRGLIPDFPHDAA